MATPTVDNFGNYLAFQGDPQFPDFPAQVTFMLVSYGNPNTIGLTTQPVPSMAFDVTDNSLWGSQDGSTWTEITGGGGGATYVYFGIGPPANTPSNPAFYYNKANGDIWAWNGSSWDQLTAH